MIISIQQSLISLGTIILYLFSLSLVQVTGFFVFISYYYRFKNTTKQDRFLIYSIGWVLGFFGTVIFLVSMYGEGMIVAFAYVLSGILFALGTLYIGFGILSYFTPIKRNYFILVSVLFIVAPPILMFTFGTHGVNLSLNVEKILVYIFLLFIGIKHRQKVLSYSKVSYFLFLTGISLSLIMLIMTQYVLQEEFLVILYFGLDIWLVVILTIFLIHLEHSISIQDKFLLKDAYSHDLANKMQKIMGFIDLAVISKELTQCKKAQEVLVEANDLLLQIREL
ncbi:MAG: hypothetical protein ACXACU_16875 [Candidatus Hodarchaeales archaeon]|jgi:hypothetical protein